MQESALTCSAAALASRPCSAEGLKFGGGVYCLHTTKASMDELRLLLGFAMVTSGKKTFSCRHRHHVSAGQCAPQAAATLARQSLHSAHLVEWEQ